MYPALTFGLPMMTALSVRPPSATSIVHVVQPGVWPGVSRAVSLAPPSSTVSRSCSTRSTLAPGLPGAVFSTSATSASHHHEFRAGVRFDEADAFIVIAMGVADQDNLRVRVLEAEPLDALSDSGHIL